MAVIKTINLARNSHVFSSKTDAFNYIQNISFPTGTKIDAFPMAFRYSGITDNSVHTALAIFYDNGASQPYVSVYEDETLININVNGIEGTVDSDSVASLSVSGHNITVGEYNEVSQPIDSTTLLPIVQNYQAISSADTLNEAFENVEKSFSAITLTFNDKINSISATSIEYTPSECFPSGTDSVKEALDYLGVAAVGKNSVQDIYDLGADATIAIDSNDKGLLPTDGYHYNLESISGLGFSNNMDAMVVGATLTFSAATDFVVRLPYSYDNNGTTVNPLHPSRIVGADRLECVANNEYIITITTACGSDGNPMNLFNMQTLVTPTSTSNNIS